MTCRYLTYEDRKRLEARYTEGGSLPEIAAELGVHLATVYRELLRGDTGYDGIRSYSADLAQRTFNKSLKQRGRKKPATAER